MERKSVLTIITVVFLAAIAVAAYITWEQSKSDLPVLNAAPDMQLDSITGEPYSFKGSNKVRLVEFIFTNCPDVCPITTAKMAQLQKQLDQEGIYGESVEFVTITIDPKRDTPEVLQEYMKKFNMDPKGWVVLRGTEEETKKVTQGFYFLAQESPDGNILHSTTIYLVDQENNIRAHYPMGNDFNQDQILKDIQSLVD